jgi:hypothetical protein
LLEAEALVVCKALAFGRISFLKETLFSVSFGISLQAEDGTIDSPVPSSLI